MSRETDSLVAYMAASGVPHRVTSTTGGQHVAGSYHYRQGTGGQGLAVDFAGVVPSSNSTSLQAIHVAFAPIRDRLAELFGPGDPGHADHVHVAVPLGFTWEVPVPTPTIPLVAGFSHGDGYVLVAADGAVYCFGCDYKGGLRWDGTAWQLR